MTRWFRFGLSVSGPFGRRCLNSLAMLRFHSPLIEPGVGFSGVHGFVRDASGSGFPSINVPGPTSTDALGINDSDLIVGYSLDASGYDRFLATPEPSRRPVRPVRAAMRASMWRNAPVPGGTIPYTCRRIAQDALRAIAGTWVDRLDVPGSSGL